MNSSNRFIGSIRARLALLIIVILGISRIASAHPLSQGSLDVTVYRDHVLVKARVTIEEIRITNSSTGDHPVPTAMAAEGQDMFDRHADYISKHLHIVCDGVVLSGRVVDATPPAEISKVTTSSAVYTIDYSLSGPAPRVVEFWHDTLADGRFPAGQSWETTYLLSMAQDGHRPSRALLARGDRAPMVCDWIAGADTQPATQPVDYSNLTGAEKWTLFKTYCIHGINHILGEPKGPRIFDREDVGFDHLLFVTALVLSTVTLWDLIKVVSAFTLAHTITLALAALKMVSVSPSISEPLIALSIVFVAVQNVFWPKQSHGMMRLAAAFFFGLFHGLGFAGGLLESMQNMHGQVVALAIVAFSVGVELGHQFVVLPLFAALKIARAARPTLSSRDLLSFRVQRYGSALISLAGAFYLYSAIHEHWFK